MGSVLAGLTKFVGTITSGSKIISFFGKTLRGLTSVLGGLAKGVLALGAVLVGSFVSGMASAASAVTGAIASHLSFMTSLSGMLEMAEEARAYWSNMADSMAFYSSSTGSTTKAMSMLTTATSKSLVGIESLKSGFISMVDAGADNDKFIEDMLPTLGDFEAKTGIAATNFASMSTKFQQMFGEKKGITKDIKDLQKALIGTGLKGAQLESTMQGLTEAAEKLGFATQGSTMDIKGLANSYGKTTAVFKAFGVSAQTTTSFLNGLVDPENVEKNMLLMNKMGISYQEYNEMLNSGKGQDKFFDKVLNNVGKVAQEANMIQDASTRFKYLKDTLGLPPEIANKLMKVTPSRMQSELRRIKKEMDEAEKKDKWRKDLKAREEKYEESMRFLKMQMVAPLISIVNKNRGTIMKFMRALSPVISWITQKISDFIKPLSGYISDFADKIDAVVKGKGDVWGTVRKGFSGFFDMIGDTLSKIWNDPDIQKFFGSLADTLMGGIIKGLSALWDAAMDKFGEYIKELGWSILKGLGVALGVLMLPITGPVAAIIGTLAAIAGAFTVWKSFDKDEANAKQTAKDMIGKKELNSDVELKKKLGDNDEFNKLEETLKKGITDKGLVGNGGLGGTNTQINDILQDLKAGDADSVQKNIAELKQELLKANGPGKEKQIDEYLKSVVDMAYENNDSAKKTAEVVQGTTEGVAKEIEKNKAALEQTKALANEKLSDAEVAAAVQKLMGDPGFMSAISSSLLTNKDKKIGELEKSVQDLTEREKGLREEFEKLKTESVPGILKQWENFLFGEQEDSVVNILMDIRDQGMDEVKARKNNSRVTSMSNARNSDIAVLNQNMASSSITGYQSQITKAASDSKIKSLPVKQTMYLKAIADSTYDAAKILNYIGKNLMFSEKGLITTTVSGPQTGKIYGMDGKAAETGKIVSGFDVIQ